MPAVCPKGHPSESADYCSVCGAAVVVPAEAKGSARPARCPNCGSLLGSRSACAECGHLLSAPDSATPWEEQLWEIVVRPDRAFYDQQDQDEMEFPDEPYARRIPLVGDHVRVGRRSASRNIAPEIDLSGSLEDTGVSHRHAVLMRQPDGNWALVDRGSTNGTFLNADPEPITPHQPFPLSHGDQVHLGAWTTLTMEHVDPADSVHSDQVSRPSKDTRHLVRGKRLMEIDLLGPLRLRVLGNDRPIGAHKTRAVLAYLSLRIGSTVSVGDLSFALWGESEPRTAGKALQGYIASLRALLPEKDSIETTPQGYRLVGPKDCVDVFRFERRCEYGRQLLASGHPAAAVAALGRALDLWRGEPLLDLADGTMGPAESVGLKERKASAEEDRFEGRLQLGDHEALVADLMPAVEAEPLRQRRWAQLMLALYRSGRHLEATRAYRRLRDSLTDCGLEPSAELVELEQAIVMKRPELDWTAPDEAGPQPSPAG